MIIEIAEILALAGLIWKLAKVHAQIERQGERIEALEALEQGRE